MNPSIIILVYPRHKPHDAGKKKTAQIACTVCWGKQVLFQCCKRPPSTWSSQWETPMVTSLQHLRNQWTNEFDYIEPTNHQLKSDKLELSSAVIKSTRRTDFETSREIWQTYDSSNGCELESAHFLHHRVWLVFIIEGHSDFGSWTSKAMVKIRGPFGFVWKYGLPSNGWMAGVPLSFLKRLKLASFSEALPKGSRYCYNDDSAHGRALVFLETFLRCLHKNAKSF